MGQPVNAEADIQQFFAATPCCGVSWVKGNPSKARLEKIIKHSWATPDPRGVLMATINTNEKGSAYEKNLKELGFKRIFTFKNPNTNLTHVRVYALFRHPRVLEGKNADE